MLQFMKNKILIPSLIILALGVFFSFKYGTNKDKPAIEEEQKTILNTVMGIMSQGHYSPRPVDDSFSRSVFDKTMENLDYEKKFFLKSDYETLKSKYRNSIDDEIRNNSLAFFNEVNNIFVQRIDEAEKIYPDLLNTPFKFDKNDSIQLDGAKLAYVQNESELKERWLSAIKYRVLSKYLDLKKTEEKKSKDSTNYKIKDFATLEKEARESVTKVQERYFKRLKKMNDNDRFALFMNSITSTEDPHTDYLPPKDKKRFEEMMSGSFIGIGASLQQQEDGKIKVAAIITGSPSWKQGKLKADDLIEKVAQGDEVPVDIEGMDLEDVVEIIRGKEGTEVQLTVRHANGTSEVIPIIRGEVELEDVFAKSAIIQEGSQRIGYIYLPEFYSNFNGITGRRSSVDIQTEVEKLKKEKVDGIVLDLRNNGGGSLSDVVDMVGLFVGPGPVVQVKSSGNQSITLKSKTPLIYTGPLAIMINGGSASASEILAAALQDYGRAVIVGSKSFGKGTVQKIVSLDQFVNSSVRDQIINALNKAKGGDAKYDGIGFLKLTIQKFYRINGGSTQLKGVTPDIDLPDAYDYLDLGERKNNAALPWDKIADVNYNGWKAKPDLSKLRKKSNARVEKNETFELIMATGKRLKEKRENNVVPLNKEKFIEKQTEAEALAKKIDALDSLGSPLTVKNVQADMAKINLDESSKQKNQDWLKGLKKDVYLHETSNIVSDWISKMPKVTMDN